MYPPDLKYTKDHEWVSIDGGAARVGITDYAQKQLGDVVYLELPEVGRRFKKGDVFGTIESVKAVSELYSPLTGEVSEVNSELGSRPEKVNTDPHGSWMIVLKVADDGSETSDLLDAAQYTDLTK
jgi:glycine cleavage system H protein